MFQFRLFEHFVKAIKRSATFKEKLMECKIIYDRKVAVLELVCMSVYLGVAKHKNHGQMDWSR